MFVIITFVNDQQCLRLISLWVKTFRMNAVIEHELSLSISGIKNFLSNNCVAIGFELNVNIWIRISYCMSYMTHLLIFIIIIKMTFFRLFEFVTMLKFRLPFTVYCLPQLIWMMMHRFHFIANKIYMIFVSFLFLLTVKMTVFSRKINSFISAMSD